MCLKNIDFASYKYFSHVCDNRIIKNIETNLMKKEEYNIKYYVELSSSVGDSSDLQFCNVSAEDAIKLHKAFVKRRRITFRKKSIATNLFFSIQIENDSVNSKEEIDEEI